MSHRVDKEKVMSLMKQDPSLSWREFTKKHGLLVSDCYYYMFRRELNGIPSHVSAGRKGGNHIFIKIFSRTSVGLTEQTKTVLNEFIEALNQRSKSKLQLLEYTDRKEIEVREQTHG